MAFYKKLGIFAAPMIMIAAGAALATGCDGGDGSDPLTAASEDVCGPCGDVKLGDVGISGSAQLDGFFSAVSTLNAATVAASADFELGLGNLEALWDLKAEGKLDARVDKLIAAIKADFSGSGDAQASLMVDITPAQCTANIDVSVQAQANCEAKGGCDVDVEAPSAEVTCTGSCTGSCEGECDASASASCEVKGPSIECSGSCEGACEFSAAAKCEGTCKGECSGKCDGTCSVALDSDGNCGGTCEGSCGGECKGSCEVSGGAKCEGKCSGSCVTEAPSAGCEGDASLKCEGSCKGSCSGGCTGEVKPGKASAKCDASVDCQAQASAQGSASMSCTPPAIDIKMELSADAKASAQAELSAKLTGLKVDGALMLQSFTKLQALITGKVDGKVAFEVAPVDAVLASLDVVVKAGAKGTLIADLPKGRIACALPALQTSMTMLGDIASEGTAAVEAQAKFAASFATGFQK